MRDSPSTTNTTDPPRHFTLLRTLTIPDALTMGNAASGMTAILAALTALGTDNPSVLWTAIVMIPLAGLFDWLDGLVARTLGGGSALGLQLDSLADVISFGVAPACLGFAMGLRAPLDMAALVFFVLCGVARLARYNATASDLSDASGKVRHFEGLPIPTSVGFALVFGILLALGKVQSDLWLGSVSFGGIEGHPLAIAYVVLGLSMVSKSVRIPKP